MKYIWRVIPFGPVNAPIGYITLMLRLCSMWTRHAHTHSGLASAFYRSSQIVDNTLLRSNSILDLLPLFSTLSLVFASTSASR